MLSRACVTMATTRMCCGARLTFGGGRRAVAELSDPAVVAARQPPLLVARVTSNQRLLPVTLTTRRTLTVACFVDDGLVLLSTVRRSPHRQLPHPGCQLDIGAPEHCTITTAAKNSSPPRQHLTVLSRFPITVIRQIITATHDTSAVIAVRKSRPP